MAHARWRDLANYPHISYYDSANDDLKYAFFDGVVWHIEIVDQSGNVGADSSLVLDTKGHPHIGYQDATGKALKYAHSDGDSWSFETADSEALAEATSLFLDASGQPHISYYDSINGDLKYAYKGPLTPTPTPTPPTATPRPRPPIQQPTQPPAVPKLILSHTVSPEVAVPGQTVTYETILRNEGNALADEIVLEIERMGNSPD
jgi:hypothetical protein